MKTTTNNYLKKQGIKTLLIWTLFIVSSLNCMGQSYPFGAMYHILQDNLIINADRSNYSANLRLQTGSIAGWNMTNKYENGETHFEISHGQGGYYVDWLETPTTKVLHLFQPGVLTLPQATSKIGIGDVSPNSKLTVGNAPNNGDAFNIRSYGTGNGWAGAGAFGGASANVVLGQLYNKAYIGAHNGALNAWADLVINGSGGKVGIGVNNPSSLLTVGPAPSDEYMVNIRSYSLSTTNIPTGGIGAFGGQHASVLLGQLDGRSYIGGATSNLNQTKDLSINPYGGNVGIGTNHNQATYPSLLTVGPAPININHGYANYNIRSFSNTNPNGWAGGGAFGGNNANVVLGQLNGKAQLAGHDHTLNIWSDLILNLEGGKVGIGTAEPIHKLDVNGIVNATGFKINGVDFTGGSSASPWTTNGNDINYATGQVEIGVDNAAAHTEYLKVHGSATFNNDLNETDLTQVSINTNVKVQGAALTVAGPTFIGSWQEVANNDDHVTADALHLDAFKLGNLFVSKGVVTEEFHLTANEKWKDEVFKEGYNLPTLKEVAQFIEENRHLPGVLSEKEIRNNGYNLHNMNQAFLEKIENLYLYSIAQEKELLLLKEKVGEIDELKTMLETLQSKLEKLESQTKNSNKN